MGAGLGDQAKLRWNFGDANSTTNSDTTTTTPVHKYSETGTYKICYEIEDQLGTSHDTVCQDITVTGTEVLGSTFDNNPVLDVYPNPVTYLFTIDYKLTTSSLVEIAITDIEGRIIESVVKSR